MTLPKDFIETLDASDNSIRKKSSKIRFLKCKGVKSGIKIYNLVILFRELDRSLCLIIAYNGKDFIRLEKNKP